jgi:hypothetical protein
LINARRRSPRRSPCSAVKLQAPRIDQAFFAPRETSPTSRRRVEPRSAAAAVRDGNRPRGACNVGPPLKTLGDARGQRGVGFGVNAVFARRERCDSVPMRPSNGTNRPGCSGICGRHPNDAVCANARPDFLEVCLKFRIAGIVTPRGNYRPGKGAAGETNYRLRGEANVSAYLALRKKAS